MRADIQIAVVEERFQLRHVLHQEAPILSHAIAAQGSRWPGHILGQEEGKDLFGLRLGQVDAP